MQCFGINPAHFDGKGNDIATAMDIAFLHDIIHVVFDGVGAHGEHGGDLFVAGTAREAGDHIELPFAQQIRALAFLLSTFVKNGKVGFTVIIGWARLA